MHLNDKEQDRNEIDYRNDAQDRKLNVLVENKLMDERQKKDVMDAYENDLRRIQMQHEEGKASMT